MYIEKGSEKKIIFDEDSYTVSSLKSTDTDPTNIKDWLCCTILCKGLEHPKISVSFRGGMGWSGTNPPGTEKDKGRL